MQSHATPKIEEIRMSGLNKIAKMYGRMTTVDQNGNRSNLVWDYVADKAVPEADMPMGSERWKASERKKWGDIRDKMNTQKTRLDDGF
jgi:hypothetical protein